MLKKAAFNWNTEAGCAFQKLKGCYDQFARFGLTESLKNLWFEFDASGLGLSAVLMQNGRPTAFYSEKLDSVACTRFVCERELMAIVFAIKKMEAIYLG